MDAIVFPVVDFLSVLTVVGDAVIVVLLVALVVRIAAIEKFVSRHALLLMLIVATTATVGSLFLSEIAGWTPCKLCWLQRIFMYPQVILFAIAMWKKDRTVVRYVIVLSAIGALIAVYHYWMQIHAAFFIPAGTELEPCDGSGVSCAQVHTFRFGYISVPMMAFTAFMLNLLGSAFVLLKKKG